MATPLGLNQITSEGVQSSTYVPGIEYIFARVGAYEFLPNYQTARTEAWPPIARRGPSTTDCGASISFSNCFST